jgi:hypothetical protein
MEEPAGCLASETIRIPSVLERLVFCYEKNDECPIFKFTETYLKKEMKSSKMLCSEQFQKEENVR